MKNIKQITNFDLRGTPVRMTITKANVYTTHPYYTISSTQLQSEDISKLGYCCEPKGIGYPIFLTLNGKETAFEIGKTGMFEFQEEDWKDVNTDPDKIRTAIVSLSEIKVPAGIRFVLDYSFD